MTNKAPKTPPPSLTKKHLAKLQREQLYRRWLIIGMIVVISLVVGLLLYGLVFQNMIQARQPVASVNNQKIASSAWQARVRFQRANLISNAQRTYQFAQSFNDPSFQASFANQLQQIKQQLDSASLGKQILSTMVDDIIIQNEAGKMGIVVSDADVKKSFQDTFGYFIDGTPTPKPTEAPIATSTLSALQLTLIPPTATPLPTAVVTATQQVEPTVVVPTPTEVLNPTATSAPTATPDKVEGSDYYKQTVDQFKTSFGVNENQFRAVLNQILKAQLFREKVQESVLADAKLTRSEPQVWARHILIADEKQAKDIYDRLQKGEDFCKLAAEFSTDESNKTKCGDLNWFGRNQMVKEFEDAAFALKVGELSQPIKSQFGFHIIQSLGNEDRPISDSAYQAKQSTKFQEWLDARKADYKIETRDDLLAARVPTEPVWPSLIDQFIAQVQQQQQPVPTIPEPTPATPAP